MNQLAMELEDSMHRTRDYLGALYAMLSHPGGVNVAAAQRLLEDATEAHGESEALRDTAFEAGRAKAA